MSPPAGRPREFDEDKVLSSALDTFWRQGYEATSVDDLLTATGLKKGSLYQAFGDKHSLFLRTLENYLSRARADVLAQLRGPGALREKLREVVRVQESVRDAQRGCYAVNCLVEMAPHDPEVKTLLADHFSLLEELLAREISQAQSSGEVSNKTPAQELAGILVTLLMGAATASKGHLSFERANLVLRTAIEQML